MSLSPPQIHFLRFNWSFNGRIYSFGFVVFSYLTFLPPIFLGVLLLFTYQFSHFESAGQVSKFLAYLFCTGDGLFSVTSIKFALSSVLPRWNFAIYWGYGSSKSLEVATFLPVQGWLCNAFRFILLFVLAVQPKGILFLVNLML